MSRTNNLDTFFNMLLNPNGVSYSILTSIPTAMIIADAKFKIRFANEKYLKLINHQKQDLLDKYLYEVRPETNLQQVIHTGQTRTDILSKTISNTVVDMSIPLFYKNKIVGGISFLKENQRILQLNQNLEKAISLNKSLSLELTSFKNNLYSAKHSFKDIIGKSKSFSKVIEVSKKVASYDTDILIIGESGTGKELFSQAIHNHSPRNNMPFIPVNCSTLTPNLIESELFGYEPNSFTGADKNGKIGLFMMANKGTIMLDEIGELPFDLQAKLLRVLQERKIRKIGSTSEHPIDVRVIAATNKDLSSLVKAGTFREDLYYRLAVFTLKLPSLRDRLDDIPMLADYLLEEWNCKYGRALKFSQKTYKNMAYQTWPGNIRELRNAVYFAAYTCDNDIINELPMQTYSLEKDTINDDISNEPIIDEHTSLKEYVETYELKIIKAMLKKYGDTLEDKKKIADILKISIPTLYNKLKT